MSGAKVGWLVRWIEADKCFKRASTVRAGVTGVEVRLGRAQWNCAT